MRKVQSRSAQVRRNIVVGILATGVLLVSQSAFAQDPAAPAAPAGAAQPAPAPRSRRRRNPRNRRSPASRSTATPA